MTEARPEELEGGFSRKAVGWIVGIAVSSFLIALLLTAFGEDLYGRPTPHANSFSRSALGHRALADLLRSLGMGVVSRRSPAGGGIGLRRPLVLAEPDEEVLQRDARRLQVLKREAAERGAALVLVLPKWRGLPDSARPEWLGEVELLDEKEVGRILASLEVPEVAAARIVRDPGGAALGCSVDWQGAHPGFQVSLSPAQLLEPAPALNPVVKCGGRLLVAHYAVKPSGPEIYVVSDPDLLNNHGLGQADNAALIQQLLGHRLGALGVVFDETIHGFRRVPGLLAEAFRFPLLLAVLQGFLLAGVVLWAGMGRFGKPLPLRRDLPGGPLGGKEVLIDNTAKLLSYGGHAADTLARYYRQTIRSVSAHFFLPSGLPDEEVAARLQQISRSRGLRMDLRDLALSIESLSPGASAGARAVDLAAMLHGWRQEMTNGHRENP